MRLTTTATEADPAVVVVPTLRPDLYYRLSVHLLQLIARGLERDVRRFSPEALATLCRHSWPGNGRELIGVIQRVTARPLPGSPAELNLLLETLKRVRFSFSRATQELNVSRIRMYGTLRRNGLQVRQDIVVGRRTVGDEHQG